MQLSFGTGILTAIPLMTAAGAAIANGTPVQFGTLQEVNVDLSFEEKKLYGAAQFPIGIGRGKGNFAVKSKLASFSAAIMGDLFFGNAAATGSIKALNDQAVTLAATTHQVVIPGAGVFRRDLGVRSATTGIPFKKVAAAPQAFQYAVDEDGEYTFNVAQDEAQILISFEYTVANDGFTLELNNQLMGESPFFGVQLNTQYQGKHLTLGLYRCASNKLTLPFKSDDFNVSDFEFSASADDAGRIGYLSLKE